MMDSLYNSEDEDRLTQHALNYKVKGEYPLFASDNEKRSIRRKAKKFEITNGEIFYIKPKDIMV